MSYCRWSSMDFGCDLYVYEAEDGIVIHVASNRVQGDVPRIDWSSPEALHSTYEEQMEFLETAERKPIGLRWDGDSYYGLTKENACARIELLGIIGYVFPEDLIKNVMETEE